MRRRNYIVEDQEAAVGPDRARIRCSGLTSVVAGLSLIEYQTRIITVFSHGDSLQLLNTIVLNASFNLG